MGRRLGRPGTAKGRAVSNALPAPGGATAPSSGCSENGPGKRSRAPQLQRPAKPAKLSLQALRQEPADGHQLSRRATQPRAGLERATPEDARGLFLQPQTHPFLRVKKLCFPGRVGPGPRGAVMSSRTARSTLRGCTEAPRAMGQVCGLRPVRRAVWRLCPQRVTARSPMRSTK